MGNHQQHSKPTTKVHSTLFTPFKPTNMKFFAVFALFVLGFALVFGQSVSPSTSPAAASASPSNSPIAASPAASASASPVAIIVNPSISPIIVASNAPIYYPVIYTYDTSAASGPAPFKFF